MYKDLIYLKESYNKRQFMIKAKLKHFKEIYNQEEKIIFSELCFCLLTPQSKAKLCDKAIQNLIKTNFLFNGSFDDIKSMLIGVRFNNNKTKYLIEARALFKNIYIKEKLKQFNDPYKLREWLVSNIKGMAYKEASHFMRNIGIYENVTILDRHILKNLVKHNVISETPKTLTKNIYFEIENKMKEFSKHLNIPIEELDLLFWSEETGEVFK